MLTASHHGNKYFFQLGKLLATKKPEVARQLISEYMPAWSDAKETDLTRIPEYFNSFCKLQNIEAKDYTGPLYKTSKIEKRRFFVAVIIVLYRPGTRLVAKYISETIKQDPSLTRRMIQEVEFRYRKLSDFKNEVDNITNQIFKND